MIAVVLIKTIVVVLVTKCSATKPLGGAANHKTTGLILKKILQKRTTTAFWAGHFNFPQEIKEGEVEGTMIDTCIYIYKTNEQR